MQTATIIILRGPLLLLIIAIATGVVTFLTVNAEPQDSTATCSATGQCSSDEAKRGGAGTGATAASKQQRGTSDNEDSSFQIPPMPPWINISMQSDGFEFRNGDVIVSVPTKSGTTWGMNILHQLRTGGDAVFDDVYREIPWIEFIERLGQPAEELLTRWNSMETGALRRGFKSHGFPPDILPYIPPPQPRESAQTDKAEASPTPANPAVASSDNKPSDQQQLDVRYLVILRNPEEACVSMKPFFEQHREEFFEHYGAPKSALTRPDFPAFFQDVCIGMGLLEFWILQFVKAWWPYRNQPNVCMMHFSDMKRDHAGSMRRIAKCLGFEPSAEEWERILEYTSFSWMKANQNKFEVSTILGFPALHPGGMVRKGLTGHAEDDGMTPQIATIIRQHAQRIVRDEAAIDFLYNGGEFD